MSTLPLLYTFRRCPYAMRARWAVQVAGVPVTQHEVSLRAKPPAMLAASPKGTVPVLVLSDGTVIDQSLDVMLWALRQSDPEAWLTPERGSLDEMLALIAACERDFKPHLDRYKYPSRYASEFAASDDASASASEADFSDRHFHAAQAFIDRLAQHLMANATAGEPPFLFGPRAGLADMAIVPFVRQMARHDAQRFAAAAPAPVPVLRWMDVLLARPDFDAIMRKAPDMPDGPSATTDSTAT